MHFFFLLCSAVCINEVMSNPLGSSGVGSPEDRNEFIEIFNMGPDSIDLSGWEITDFDAVDEIVSFSAFSGNSNTVISAGEFALIMDPEYIDSGENYMPYGAPPCVLLTVGNTTIGNGIATTDRLALISPDGDTVSTYFSPFNPGDGISVERVHPYTGDVSENWKPCEGVSGSTPGRQNSVYSSPDFLLDSLWVVDDNISFLLVNQYDAVLSGTIEVFEDKDRDRILDEGELIDSFILVDVGQDSICNLDFVLSSEGVYFIGFDLVDEIVFRRVRIGEGISELIINEVMYAPGGPPEWIELFNRSGYNLTLDSLKIDDVSISRIEILSEDYLIVVSDSSDFLSYYGDISSTVKEISLSLSNSGDSILLFDDNGFLFDKVVYSGDETATNFTLERINPEIPADNSTNWGQSVMAGGTPGEVNSIFADYKRENVALAVTPEHFTPDGDGVDETCVISFNLPYVRNQVTLKIYDRKGHLLREFLNSYGGESGEYIWDGKGRKDEIVATGLYVVFLLIEDVDNSARSVEKAVVSVGR